MRVLRRSRSCLRCSWRPWTTPAGSPSSRTGKPYRPFEGATLLQTGLPIRNRDDTGDISSCKLLEFTASDFRNCQKLSKISLFKWLGSWPRHQLIESQMSIKMCNCILNAVGVQVVIGHWNINLQLLIPACWCRRNYTSLS